jgi:hypothetical protein
MRLDWRLRAQFPLRKNTLRVAPGKEVTMVQRVFVLNSFINES